MTVIQSGSAMNKIMTVFTEVNCRFVTASFSRGDTWLNIEGNYVRALNWHNP